MDLLICNIERVFVLEVHFHKSYIHGTVGMVLNSTYLIIPSSLEEVMRNVFVIS